MHARFVSFLLSDSVLDTEQVNQIVPTIFFPPEVCLPLYGITFPCKNKIKYNNETLRNVGAEGIMSSG